MHNYLAFIYFGCGVCLFLFACSQLLVRNKQALHYWMFFDCLFLSYLLMYFWAVSERSLPYIPAALASSEISGTFCMVPFLYAASQAILWGGAPPIRRFGLYLIPPAVFALGLIGFGLSHTFWLSMFMVFIAGIGMMQGMAASNTIIQTLVTEDKRGRVMSFYTMAFMGMAPFGSLLAGSLASAIGAPIAVIVTGTVVLLGAAWFFTRLPAIRRVIRPIYREMGIIPVEGGVQS